MGARTASVYDAFGNAFVIKVSDLFSKNEVLHQGGAAISGFRGVLIIVYANTLIRGKEFSSRLFTIRRQFIDLALSEPYPAPDGISGFEIFLSLVAFEAFVLLTELLVFFPLAMVFPFQLPDSMNLYQHVPNQTRPTEARYKRVNYRAPAFFVTFVVLDFFAWQLR